MTFQGDGCPPVGPSRGQRARRKAIAIVVPTGVALGAGAMIANAAIPASDGTIGACYVPGGSVRFVDSAADCKTDPTGGPSEQFLKFNVTGPAGPTGATGATGAAGAPGAPGAPVAPGGVTPRPAPAAASDYYLEIDGIKGESSDQKHKDTIHIESFSWGATNTGAHSSGGGGGAGKVSFQDLHFTAPVSKASPLLFSRCATGQHIKKATLFVRKAGGDQQDYYVIKLEDVLVSSYQTKPDADNPSVPVDAFSLNFTKISYSVAPTTADGKLAGAPLISTYDLKALKK